MFIKVLTDPFIYLIVCTSRGIINGFDWRETLLVKEASVGFHVNAIWSASSTDGCLTLFSCLVHCGQRKSGRTKRMISWPRSPWWSTSANTKTSSPCWAASHCIRYLIQLMFSSENRSQCSPSSGPTPRPGDFKIDINQQLKYWRIDWWITAAHLLKNNENIDQCLSPENIGEVDRQSIEAASSNCTRWH